MSETAPFHADLAEGPSGGRAHWLHAGDGVRLRAVVWPEGSRGTVLIFPGRSEYAEKYGRAASDLAARGYASVAVDWRGQGLADRLLADPMTGHVSSFGAYQGDVAAVLALIEERALPRPLYLLAHSMGGAIGLRALMRGLPVNAAVFSAPMWGIKLAPQARPAAWALTRTARLVRQSHRYAPGTGAATYIGTAPFEGNVLTTDLESYTYMQRQIGKRPELALGGPSLHWLHEAMLECRMLEDQPSPGVPALTMLGTRERVVDPAPVHARMARWPGGRLDLIEGAEHEIILERASIRQDFFDRLAGFFVARP